MSYELLDNIDSIASLKALSAEKIPDLCSELRSFLIETAEQSGGHLASNLGTVELSVAMHRVFDSPRDHFIFDVGHQAYVHKILTGRRDRFSTLRRPGGLSGFTARRESEHDAFGAGHSSTSLSASLGFAEGDRLSGKDSFTVCVIGDGAYTGGMVHEAINNCSPDLRLVIILNENGMSISENKGAFASYLSRVRLSKKYRSVKSGATSFLGKLPLVGRPIKAVLSLIKRGVKRVVFSSNYFEDLGFYYLGPIDGNDYKKVEWALSEAKRLEKCVFVHLKTVKGKGLPEAESSPESFHSMSSGTPSATFHSEVAEELLSMASEDERITAITAAMGIGTGLSALEESFGERYFDVGIAEEHALTFSAGLAANGMKPYVAIYSTFLQRGYDNILHDIALQGLPVRLLIDRAGISVADGATHHGIFDVSFLSHIPGVELISPATFGSLRAALRYSRSSVGPIAIRYPNSAEDKRVVERFYSDLDYDSFGIRTDFDNDNPPKNVFVTYGGLTARVACAEEILTEKGIECGIILAERIKPFAPLCEFISKLIQKGSRIVFAEEGIKNGGAAMIIGEMLRERGFSSADSYRIAAIDDSFLVPDEPCDIYEYAGLSPSRLSNYFID